MEQDLYFSKPYSSIHKNDKKEAFYRKEALLMTEPYHCPNCKTNRTRFNLIEQQPKIVKLDANTGDIVSELSAETIEPFHMQYKGPSYKVQCGVCGLLEDESMFTKYAAYSQKKENL